jgi:DNA topoisomerase IA
MEVIAVPEIVIVTESKTKAERIKSFYPDTGITAVATGGSIADVEFTGDRFNIYPSEQAMQSVQNLLRTCRGKIVYIASDYDREGEFIALACENFLSGVAKRTERVDLKSMSDEDCAALLDRQRDLNIPMAYSAILRRHFDRDIGIRYSQAVSEKLGGRYPIGRIQVPLAAHIQDKPFNIRAPIYPPRTADVIASLSDRKVSMHEASAGLQRGYEKGLLSYIRTDSCFLPQDALENFRKSIGWDGAQVAEPEYEFEQLAHSCIYSLDYGKNNDAISKTVDGLLYSSVCGMEVNTGYASHTEGELVRYMQEMGLARPSTYVTSIESVVRNQYAVTSVSPEGRTFGITERGERMLEVVREEFPFLEFVTRPMEKTFANLECGLIGMKDAFRDLKQLEDAHTGRIVLPEKEPVTAVITW